MYGSYLFLDFTFHAIVNINFLNFTWGLLIFLWKLLIC